MTAAIILYLLGMMPTCGLLSYYIEETGEMDTLAWKLFVAIAWPAVAVIVAVMAAMVAIGLVQERRP